MSIVRVGLSEGKNFSEGYEAIFGKKHAAKTRQAEPKKQTRAARKKNKTTRK